MKVIVTAETQLLDGAVDGRFGRCKYFIKADVDTLEHEAFENPGISATGGAGIQAAQFVAHKDVSAVISGNFGPKAFQALNTAGIKMYTAHARSVREAIEDYKKGRLTEVASPTAAEHSGI